jgi:hypothetical protein
VRDAKSTCVLGRPCQSLVRYRFAGPVKKSTDYRSPELRMRTFRFGQALSPLPPFSSSGWCGTYFCVWSVYFMLQRFQRYLKSPVHPEEANLRGINQGLTGSQDVEVCLITTACRGSGFAYSNRVAQIVAQIIADCARIMPNYPHLYSPKRLRMLDPAPSYMFSRPPESTAFLPLHAAR